MAGLGHIAVGLAAAHWERRREAPLLQSHLASCVLFAGLSLAPDLDVLGLAAGVPYGAEWGHRGATHSPAFAALLAALLGLGAALLGRPVLRSALLGFVVVSSHGLLDALTDGGLGVALLWPVSTRRIFAPVTPIPVAPLGRDVASLRGLYVAAEEAVLFLPLLVYSVLGRIKRRR